jgi:chromosome segregation ATPase
LTERRLEDEDMGDEDRASDERRVMSDDKGLRGRVSRHGEEAIGKVAQGMLDNPVVNRALSAAFETRQRATRAQEVAMGALNLPSAGDLERLTRRLRNVSQRLETIEDGLDRLEQRIDQLGSASSIEKRLTAIEEVLARIEATLAEQSTAPAAVAAEFGDDTPQG